MREVTSKARQLVQERGAGPDFFATVKDALLQAVLMYCDARRDEVVITKDIKIFGLKIITLRVTYGDLRNVLAQLLS